MYRITAAIFIIIISAVSVSYVSAGVDMRDGKWEITTQMEMPGMPMAMPAFTHTQCLTTEQNVPQGKNRNEECSITKSDVSGNTVTWEMQCNNQGKTMKGKGRITYSGTTFKGEMQMDAEGMSMTQKMSGRRIGDCK